jgi:hypothetical protein
MYLSLREYLLDTRKIGQPPLFWSDQQRINQSLQKKSEARVAPCSVPCVCLRVPNCGEFHRRHVSRGGKGHCKTLQDWR